MVKVGSERYTPPSGISHYEDGYYIVSGVVQMDLWVLCLPLWGWGAPLRVPDCPKLPGNERISPRAFQRAPEHPKRTSLDKVTALQRWRIFRNSQLLSIGNPGKSPKRVRNRNLALVKIGVTICDTLF